MTFFVGKWEAIGQRRHITSQRQGLSQHCRHTPRSNYPAYSLHISAIVAYITASPSPPSCKGLDPLSGTVVGQCLIRSVAMAAPAKKNTPKKQLWLHHLTLSLRLMTIAHAGFLSDTRHRPKVTSVVRQCYDSGSRLSGHRQRKTRPFSASFRGHKLWL